MTEIITIDELFNKSSLNVYIDKVPTTSKHEPTIRKTLNSLLNEQPDWYSCIASIVVYPVQLWASESRKNLKIDLVNLQSVIDEEGSFFGISTVGRFNQQILSMKETQKALEMTSEVIRNTGAGSLTPKQAQVIQSIHGMTGDPVTRFLIDSYYESAIRRICDIYADAFNKYNFRSDQGNADENMGEVFHNTDLLIRQTGALRYIRYKSTSDIDYEEAYETVMRCIDELNTFPMEGQLLSRIAKSYAFGITESQIAKSEDRSRTYIRSKYYMAVEVISYLLWGYSTREILSGLAQ